MRDLVRRILSEQKEKYDTLELLRNYKGNDITLQNLGRKLRVVGKITKEELKRAISQFKKEYYATSILDSLRNDTKLQDEIKSLGTKTYNNLIRTNKRKMLEMNKTVKVSQPERNWILENIQSLVFFKDNVKDTTETFNFPDRKESQTIKQECYQLIRQLGGRDFWGFIEKNDWSILNRINTNYTNWIKLIAKKDVEGYLSGKTTRDKVNSYFEEKPIEQVIDMSDFDEEQKKIILNNVPKLSFADSDVISLLISADDPENDYDYTRMVERVKKTTEIGEAAEQNFINHLISNGIPKSDIKKFSSFGNLVDITFQCDLMVKLNGTWTPIQVKSKEQKYSKLLSYNIGGLLVYPAPSKYQCGKWIYYTGKSLPKSFDEDFLHISC